MERRAHNGLQRVNTQLRRISMCGIVSNGLREGVTLLSMVYQRWHGLDPRSRAGSDDTGGWSRPAYVVSIRAPARGATPAATSDGKGRRKRPVRAKLGRAASMPRRAA